jgi:low affinity Fe/Cu permease
MCRVRDAFRIFARWASEILGSAWVFVIAIGVIIIWALSGHLFDYSDTWQLIINTGTTIVTFLMVFLIQNTQNRDAKAVHLKLDELIRALEGARDHLVDLEKLSDDELKKLETEFERVREHAEHAEKVAQEAADTVEEHCDEPQQMTGRNGAGALHARPRSSQSRISGSPSAPDGSGRTTNYWRC